MKNKENELVFYEITDFIYYLEDEKRLSHNTILAYKTDILEYILMYDNDNAGRKGAEKFKKLINF